MNKNKTRTFNKINQILLYSQNYLAHKKNLNKSKSCIDDSSIQRNQYNQKLLIQHNRYTDAIKNLKDGKLNHQNKKITQRLLNVSKPKSKEKIIEQNKKSMTSRSFWNLKTAKQRQRDRQNKQIEMQNKKMTQRISKSRSKQDFGRQSYFRQKRQSKKDLNIMGQYSQRSQSVLQNLVFNDLKLKSQDIPFLPQLSSRHHQLNTQSRNNSIQKIDKKNKFKSNFHRENIKFQKQLNFKR